MNPEKITRQKSINFPHPFAGSNTTGFVADILQRRWICFEINENYIIGSRYRFGE